MFAIFGIFKNNWAPLCISSISQAVKAGDIKCNFKGLAMGDSWISPEDSTAMWGPYCYTNVSTISSCKNAQFL